MLKKINLNSMLIVLFLLISVQLSYAGYDDFTVNVPNVQGGYTALVIKKFGTGYTGPQGEYYPDFPTIAQLQVMYGLGSHNPTIVPVSYVQVPVQNVVTYQVVNQVPYEDRDEDYNHGPTIRPNITEEVVSPGYHKEDENDWNFFEFKKKKKSQQSQNNQNTTKPANPLGNNKPPKQSQGTNNPPKDVNKGQPPQKQKTDSKEGGSP